MGNDCDVTSNNKVKYNLDILCRQVRLKGVLNRTYITCFHLNA
jgi:hypothetical protein